MSLVTNAIDNSSSVLQLTTPLSPASAGTGVASPTAHTLPVAQGSSAFTFLGPLTNGQLLIGSTGANPVATTLTAGSGVTITNGAGTITLALSSGQVIQTVFLNNIAGSTNSTASYVDVTGASLAITPTNSSNKVDVTFSFNTDVVNSTFAEANYKILRGAVDISTEAGNPITVVSKGGDITTWITWTLVDAPATTSATTYKLQHVPVSSTSVESYNVSITLQELTA